MRATVDNKVSEVQRLAETIRDQTEKFHIAKIPHSMTLVLGLCTYDYNLLLAWSNELPERLFIDDDGTWWGDYQIVEDPSVKRGQGRLLIDARSL